VPATYPIDNYAVRLWPSRPTSNLNPGVTNAGLMTGQEPTGEEEGIAG
jgi:hypothetical protein